MVVERAVSLSQKCLNSIFKEWFRCIRVLQFDIQLGRGTTEGDFKKRIKSISPFHLFLWQDTQTAVFVPKNKQKFDTIYFKVYTIKGNVPKVCPFSSWNSKNTSNKQYINFRSMEETKYWLLALLWWRLEKCHKNSVPLYHDQ